MSKPNPNANPHAAYLRALGVALQTPERRKEISRLALSKRWAKKDKEKKRNGKSKPSTVKRGK